MKPKRIAEAVPRARAKVLERAGHLAPLEVPDQFWSELRAFLGCGDAAPV